VDNGAAPSAVLASADAGGAVTSPSGGLARAGVAGSDLVTRVVVADDADGIRELVCVLLDTEPDFTVVGRACDGAQAVDVVAETAPDLVVLDVVMPVLDGLHALPQVRQIAPDACVVVFTGLPEQSVREEALALGADALLDKGVVTGPFVEILRDACRTRRGVSRATRI
jgi:DNA-binding NarL/FixJ family response regulator